MIGVAGRGGAVIALGVAAASIAGCRGALPMPSADDLSSWSRTPLAPDPGMAKLALEHTSCRAGFPEGGPITVVTQDRRTASTAAFFLVAPGHFGSCLVSVGGFGGGGSTNVVPELDGVLTVDEQGTSISGEARANTLGGLTAPNVSSVRVGLDDGTVVVATVENGYWLSWWPGAAAAARVSALDSAGVVVGVLAPSPEDWVSLGAAQ